MAGMGPERRTKKGLADPEEQAASKHPTRVVTADRKSTRLNSSHRTISYAVFCLKKKLQIHRQVRAEEDWVGRDAREDVALDRNFEDAEGRSRFFEVGDLVGPAMRQRHSAPLYSD